MSRFTSAMTTPEHFRLLQGDADLGEYGFRPQAKNKHAFWRERHL